MTQSTFDQVKISGIATTVPEKEISLEDEAHYYGNDAKKIQRLKKIVGMDKRRVVEGNITASDLCIQSAQTLIRDMDIVIKNIDALIFVVQTPDYLAPATACYIHKQLNLPSQCLAFDVNQGCAGYTYGLWLASTLIAGGGCKNVLLLAGDTWSTKSSVGNRITAPVFGDAGSATLLSFQKNAPPSFYELGINSTGFESIIIPAGGAKIPFSEHADENIDLLKELKCANNLTHLHNIHMAGMDVFHFTMNTIPSHIQTLMRYAKVEEKQIDYLVLHQANKQIIQQIALTLNFPLEKVPHNAFSKYGNTTIASIPTAICDELSDQLQENSLTALLSGFGIGLAWASCYVTLDNIYCPKIQTFNVPENHASRENLIAKWLNQLQGVS